jgi:hypothetical protein
MQQPGRFGRRDWILIGGIIVVVSVGWMGLYLALLRPRTAKPVAQAGRPAATRPIAQATQPAASQPYVLVDPRLQWVPAPAPVPQSQPEPATPPTPAPLSSRDAALLEALQRAEQLKKQGRPGEALTELQHALQGEPSAASPSQPGQDFEGQLAGLLGQLSQSTQPGQSADTDALLSAALRAFAGSATDLSGFLEELEGDVSGRPRSSDAASLPRPALPAQAQVVAYVYGQPITRQEIGASADGPTDESVTRLNGRILQMLFEIHCKSQGITASLAEINEYRVATGARPIAPAAMRPPLRPRPGRPAGIQPPQPRPSPGQIDPVAESAVLGWKVQRSLYESYRGTVITGPSGRLEPVGAYREFLREQQQKAAFRITDPRYQERFWAYYDQDFGSRVVPPEKVDFGKPWWAGKPALR